MINDFFIETKLQGCKENLYRVMNEIYVYECGINETNLDMNVLSQVRQANFDALRYLREEAGIVAMAEIKKIKRDIIMLNESIKQRIGAIKSMEFEIKRRKNECGALQNIIRKMEVEMIRGKVLEFKR